ncbi:MAG: hypothetical protein ILO34_07695 [Kiritimatiellae bacterium]|nr:hypothetical protein [Kiritimatiellia bacterium]
MKMFGLTTGSETKPFAGKACALAVFVAVCALFAQAVEPYQLERDSEDQTAMRSGCTVFLRAHPGDYHKA